MQHFNLPLHLTIKLLVTITIVSTSCFTKIPKGRNTTTINHAVYNVLLQKYVDKNGLVNYNAFINDSVALNQYLTYLGNNVPNGYDNESLAYWINAYNAFTIKTILQHSKVSSIKDISPVAAIPFVNTVWDIKNITLAGKQTTLNTIEHKILRKKFNDPRIHFAINCASISCPILLNKAYEGATINEQLNMQAATFINDTTKNNLDANNPKVSSLFNWFGGDFKTKHQNKIDFINKYAFKKLPANTKLGYMPYNWQLNKQPINTGSK